MSIKVCFYIYENCHSIEAIFTGLKSLHFNIHPKISFITSLLQVSAISLRKGVLCFNQVVCNMLKNENTKNLLNLQIWISRPLPNTFWAHSPQDRHPCSGIFISSNILFKRKIPENLSLIPFLC